MLKVGAFMLNGFFGTIFLCENDSSGLSSIVGFCREQIFTYFHFSFPLVCLGPTFLGAGLCSPRGVSWGWGSAHFSSDRISSARRADVTAGTVSVLDLS